MDWPKSGNKTQVEPITATCIYSGHNWLVQGWTSDSLWGQSFYIFHSGIVGIYDFYRMETVILRQKKKWSKYKNRSENEIVCPIYSWDPGSSHGLHGVHQYFYNIINSFLAEPSVYSFYNLVPKESKMEFSYTKFSALFIRQITNNHLFFKHLPLPSLCS